MAKKPKYKVCVNLPGESLNTNVESHEDIETAILLAAKGLGLGDYEKIESHDSYFECTLAGDGSEKGISSQGQPETVRIMVHQWIGKTWSSPAWHLLEKSRKTQEGIQF